MTGFKNYLQHEARFLGYLERRDSCDETTLGCYQRFFRHLAEKDLGGALDQGLASHARVGERTGGEPRGVNRTLDVARLDSSGRGRAGACNSSRRDLVRSHSLLQHRATAAPCRNVACGMEEVPLVGFFLRNGLVVLAENRQLRLFIAARIGGLR